MDGNPSRHRALEVLDRQLRRLAPAPRDRGEVRLVVLRGPNDHRETPDRARVTRDGGVAGDRWIDGKAKPECQVSVIRADVAAVLGGGQDLALFGDNLVVDLDLNPAHLPPGTRVRAGTALFEVTPEPHTGCKKFRARFGLDALKILKADDWIDHRLRGIYWRVIEDGEIAPGDAIEVVRSARSQAD